jgi:hypothetical protein
MHFVPSYVRSELKKKTGIAVDEFGKKIEESNENISTDQKNINEVMFKIKDPTAPAKQKKQDNTQYTPINVYKPSGNFIYNDDLINKLGDKFT